MYICGLMFDVLGCGRDCDLGYEFGYGSRGKDAEYGEYEKRCGYLG